MKKKIPKTHRNSKWRTKGHSLMCTFQASFLLNITFKFFFFCPFDYTVLGRWQQLWRLFLDKRFDPLPCGIINILLSQICLNIIEPSANSSLSFYFSYDFCLRAVRLFVNDILLLLRFRYFIIARLNYKFTADC